MPYKIVYKGRKLSLTLRGEKARLSDISKVLEAAHRLDSHEPLETVANKIKSDLEEFEDQNSIVSWWDLPHDITHNKEAFDFLLMEADLNNSLYYTKIVVKLVTVVNDLGQQLAFDRNQLKELLLRSDVKERLAKTNSVLVRVKGSLPRNLRHELKDYLQKTISVDRLKVVFEKKNYGDRASLELILFGDFPEE